MPGKSRSPAAPTFGAKPKAPTCAAPEQLQARGNAHVQDQLRAASPLATLEARWQAVRDSVATEDAVDGGRPEKAPADRTATQLAAALQTADVAHTAAADPCATANALVTFANAVTSLESAYRRSSLVSTDAPATGPWAPDATRDALGSATVDAKIAGWQAASEAGPDPLRAVKFAVVTRAEGPPIVRVGWGTSHVRIAGGNALAAGLLRFDLKGARPVVTELENVSGGFRPGPLRNAIAREAVTAAGYTPGDTVRTHDKADGNYGGSWMESTASPPKASR